MRYMHRYEKGEQIFSEKQYAKMIEALENKGFRCLGSRMWHYRSKNKRKFITVRIDFAGYIIVNFNGRLTKAMTPSQVIAGSNFIKGKEDHPVIYV